MSQPKSRTIQEMEQDIALGYNPGCYKCGTTLIIKNQEGNDGSKGYSYSCPNKLECNLEDCFVKLSTLRQIKQALLKKVSIYALSVLGGSAVLLSQFGNKLGLGNLFGKEPQVILTTDNDSINLYLRNLKLVNDSLLVKLSNSSAKAEPNVTNEDLGKSKIPFIDKYHLALLYSGNNVDTKEIENYTNAKNLLFELVDQYNRSSEMTNKQAIQISIAIANLRHNADSIDCLEIIKKIDKCRIDLDAKYLRQAEVYYVMGYNNVYYKKQSLLYYLKSASLKKLPTQSISELNSQLKALKLNRKLTFWNEERLQNLSSSIASDSQDSLQNFISELEGNL